MLFIAICIVLIGLSFYIGYKHGRTVEKINNNLNENLKEGYKTCTSCNQTLLLENFNKQKGGRFGKSSECKSCLKERNKDWRENKNGKKWENQWMKNKNLEWKSFKKSYFYSDSINDLPLLELVNKPIAVNPDRKLKSMAKKRNWHILNLVQNFEI